MATTNMDLAALGASITIENGIAYIQTFDEQRHKIGTVTSYNPLIVEIKLDASEFDLSGNTPPKSLNDISYP